MKESFHVSPPTIASCSFFSSSLPLPSSLWSLWYSCCSPSSWSSWVWVSCFKLLRIFLFDSTFLSSVSMATWQEDLWEKEARLMNRAVIGCWKRERIERWATCLRKKTNYSLLLCPTCCGRLQSLLSGSRRPLWWGAHLPGRKRQNNESGQVQCDALWKTGGITALASDSLSFSFLFSCLSWRIFSKFLWMCAWIFSKLAALCPSSGGSWKFR